jgi:UPF0755 protein
VPKVRVKTETLIISGGENRVLKIICKFLLLAAAVAFGAAGIYIEMERALIPERYGQTTEVIVSEGRSAGEAAAEFERMGAVTNGRELARWMVRNGIDKKLLPGMYRVTAGRPKDVAAQLSSMKPEVPSVTILPGALFEDISFLLGANGTELLTAALGRDENFPAQMKDLLPGKGRDRIVLLAPETYAVTSGDNRADRLISAASGMWWKQHGAFIPEGTTSADVGSLGVLASVVQKEALIDSDRPIIAGVFKNRLEIGMPLQSCATVVHAWRLRGVKISSVSYNDVKIDSPFNTYIHKGLPPENIGTPSASSWNAALDPADTDMLFFFAREDGSHVFTRTYKEHLEAQKK